MLVTAFLISAVLCGDEQDGPPPVDDVGPPDGGEEGSPIPEDTPTPEPTTPDVDVPKEPAHAPFFFDNFQNDGIGKTWIPTKSSNYTGEWKVLDAKAPASYPGERLLVASTASAYHGISVQFDKPLDVSKGFVVQYEWRQLETLECGGAYLKIFGAGFKAGELTNESGYEIMFGPDKCGATNKVHFIFRHKNPLSGVIEEKALKNAPSTKYGGANHLYTLKVWPTNEFEILIDGESSKKGSLLEDFEPPVNPPKEIDDPEDHKPADWVDLAEIDDPAAVKPDDWNESEPEFVHDPAKLDPPEGWRKDAPKFVPDPEAKKPDDWDDDIHGEWDAPKIPNPECAEVGCGDYEPPLIKNALYKGIWKAPKIPNPEYKGPWKARQIANPYYFEDKNPAQFKPIVGFGYEVWLVTKDQAFGNVYFDTDLGAVDAWNAVHFKAKEKAQKKALEPKGGGEGGAGGSVKKFVGSVKDAWMDLWEDKPVLAIGLPAGVGVLIVVLSVLSCCCCCGGKKAAPVAQAPPAAPVAPVAAAAAAAGGAAGIAVADGGEEEPIAQATAGGGVETAPGDDDEGEEGGEEVEAAQQEKPQTGGARQRVAKQPDNF